MECTTNSDGRITISGLNPKISDVINESSVYHFVKPKFRQFKRKYLSGTPPYELEQEQMDVALKRREHRYEYLAKNGNDSLNEEK